jgi:hypothetical protein
MLNVEDKHCGTVVLSGKEEGHIAKDSVSLYMQLPFPVHKLYCAFCAATGTSQHIL